MKTYIKPETTAIKLEKEAKIITTSSVSMSIYDEYLTDSEDFDI